MLQTLRRWWLWLSRFWLWLSIVATLIAGAVAEILYGVF